MSKSIKTMNLVYDPERGVYPKIVLGEDEISVMGVGHLDEIILDLEVALPKDRRSKEYKAALSVIYQLYELSNRMAGFKRYAI
jgi:hypothetical protein